MINILIDWSVFYVRLVSEVVNEASSYWSIVIYIDSDKYPQYDE